MLTQRCIYDARRGRGRFLPKDAFHVCTVKVEWPTTLHATELWVTVNLVCVLQQIIIRNRRELAPTWTHARQMLCLHDTGSPSAIRCLAEPRGFFGDNPP